MEWGSSEPANYWSWWSCLYSMWYLLHIRETHNNGRDFFSKRFHYISPKSLTKTDWVVLIPTARKEKPLSVSWHLSNHKSSLRRSQSCSIPSNLACGCVPHQSAVRVWSYLQTSKPNSLTCLQNLPVHIYWQQRKCLIFSHDRHEKNICQIATRVCCQSSKIT